jgi:hypothetical protein
VGEARPTGLREGGREGDRLGGAVAGEYVGEGGGERSAATAAHGRANVRGTIGAVKRDLRHRAAATPHAFGCGIFAARK